MIKKATKKCLTFFSSNHTIYHSFLISYLIIGIVLSTVYTAFSGVLQRKLEKEYLSSYEYTISNFSADFHQLINTLSMSISQVAGRTAENQIHTILNGTPNDSSDYIYYKTLFSNVLNLNKAEICQIGIYFPTKNTVLSERGYQTLSSYHTEHYPIKTTSAEDLKNLLTNVSTYSIYINSDTQFLYYKYHTIFDNNDAVIFACAKIQKHIQIIDKIHSSTNANIVLYNSNSNIILTTDTFIDNFNSFLTKGTPHYIETNYSSIPGWNVYILNNEKSYISSIRTLNILMYCTVFLGLFAAFIFALYFSKKHYMPIKALTKNFSASKGETHKYDEFAFIQQNIQKIISKNTIFTEKLSNIEQENALKNFIVGDLTESSSNTILFSDDIKNNFWVVALLKISPLSLKKLFEYDYTQTDIDAIITNIGQELLEECFNGLILPIEKKYCILLNSTEIKEKDLSDLFAQITKCVNLYFNISVSIYASKIEQGYKNIPHLYSDVCDIAAVSDFLALEQQQIKFYNDYKAVPIHKTSSVVTQKNLTKLLRQNQPEEISALMNEAIDFTINNITSINTLNEEIYQILILLTRSIEEIFSSIDELIPSKYDPIQNIFPYKNLNELKSNISEYSILLCNYIVSLNIDIPLEKKIAEYIKSHYKDPNLDATIISEKFNIHTVHLSRIFKEYFNTGLHQYLTQLRIEEAKELLCETDKTVEEIGNLVGYNNIYSFSRAFKRITEFSPSQYRNNTKNTDK